MPIDSLIEKAQFQVFCSADEPALTGNLAVVFLSKQALSNQQMQALATQQGAPASCFIILSSSAQIYCFNTSQAIQCCGHGALAASTYLLQQGYDYSYLQQQNTRIQINNKAPIQIGLTALTSQSIVTPEWAKALFSPDIIATAQTSALDGYLILELDSHVDLASLTPKLSLLAQHSQRAVILTQWLGGADNSYRLRYFAPQYGNDEDQVTASAQRVLAPFWQQKKHPQQSHCNFTALQLSSSGGKLSIKINHKTVWISGLVKQLDTWFITNNRVVVYASKGLNSKLYTLTATI